MQWNFFRLNLRAAGAIFALILAAFGAGWYLGERRSAPLFSFEPPAEAPEDADLEPFFTAWRLLEENFAASSSSTPRSGATERIYGAISGLAEAYGDPYTNFFPPVENENFISQVRGDFGGVGMEIGRKDGALLVIAPLKGTPAARAGIEPGDLILAIDGVDASGLAVDQAVVKIRGPRGTEVSLTLARNGETFDVTIVRDTIILPTLDTKLRPDGVFVISLYNFDAKAAQVFRNAIREFAESGTDMMLIDLRGNPGGYLEVAVDMASWFLPPGAVVVTQAYQDPSQNEINRSYGYDVFTDRLKLAVLIDGSSASAAEIFAGALREHGKATLVGEQSFGKGSVQQLFPVTSDTSLKITVARWLTPGGTSLSHEGLAPDIEVARTDEDRNIGRDPQFDRAVEFLLTGT